MPPLRAVSGVVGAIEGGAGGFRAGNGAYAAGSLAFPIGRSFGFQADLAAIANGGDLGLGAAGHAFLRDPTKGLIGLYGSVDYATSIRSYGLQDVGTTMGRIAGEGALFLDRFTVDGIAGWQMGVARSISSTRSTCPGTRPTTSASASATATRTGSMPSPPGRSICSRC